MWVIRPAGTSARANRHTNLSVEVFPSLGPLERPDIGRIKVGSIGAQKLNGNHRQVSRMPALGHVFASDRALFHAVTEGRRLRVSPGDHYR